MEELFRERMERRMQEGREEAEREAREKEDEEGKEAEDREWNQKWSEEEHIFGNNTLDEPNEEEEGNVEEEKEEEKEDKLQKWIEEVMEQQEIIKDLIIEYPKVYMRSSTPPRKRKTQEEVAKVKEEAREKLKTEKGFEYEKVYSNILSPMRKSKKRKERKENEKRIWEEIFEEDEGVETVKPQVEVRGRLAAPEPKPGLEFEKQIFGKRTETEVRMTRRRGNTYRW